MPGDRIELSTSTFSASRSTTEIPRHYLYFKQFQNKNKKRWAIEDSNLQTFTGAATTAPTQPPEIRRELVNN